MPHSGPKKNPLGNVHLIAFSLLLALGTITLFFQERSSWQANVLPFMDVDWNSRQGNAVFFLLSHGIINGFPDNTFKGDEYVTRAQAAKIMLLAGALPITHTANNGKFTDVAEDEWYTPYVATAADRGIIRGYHSSQSQAQFKPRNPVSTAEFLTMLGRTFDFEEYWPHGYRDVPQGTWYSRHAGNAWYYELFPERIFYLEPQRPLTRYEIAIAIHQLYRQPERKKGLPWWIPPRLPGLSQTSIPLQSPRVRQSSSSSSSFTG
ncbi:hypothetical protein COU77_00610, partial [Candidatus Peregrinibacteria bacterium CG10_big_fil_rev_8_21_14_0_10_49_16]